jgi:hypothetical protein
MIKFIIFILIFFLAVVNAQSKRYTKGAENGYAWQAMENPHLIYNDSKYNYLSGILERYSLMQEKYPKYKHLSCKDDVTNLLKEGNGDKITLDDIVDAIDDFYQVKENMIVPILFAYCYCIKDISGLNKNELEMYRTELLKFSQE